MNLLDERLRRFDEPVKKNYPNFTPTIFKVAKTKRCMLSTCHYTSQLGYTLLPTQSFSRNSKRNLFFPITYSLLTVSDKPIFFWPFLILVKLTLIC
jgi:hypothetical protein